MPDEIPQGPAAGGGAVDSYGRASPDPSKNVLDLTHAAVKRLDDLMTLQIQRQDDLRIARAHHIDEIIRIRSEYQNILDEKEKARIDDIRAVDASAVARASEVAAAQATALATQVAASAETLRTTVAAAATATATNLSAALNPIQQSISELRQVQFQAQGEKAAKTESKSDSQQGRDTNQWAVGIAIGLVVAAVNIALHYIK